MLLRKAVAPLAGLALVLHSESVSAQVAPCVISSRLLNRVAAAVDGYGSGEQVWVITQCNDTATVTATATSEAEARRLGQTGLILGPYGAKRERAAFLVGMDQQSFDVIIRRYMYCWHEQETSVMGPRQCNDPTLPTLDLVAAITVQFKLRDGKTIERQLPPSADVLFLKYSALEKFAFPYYQRILGLTGVVDMRASMLGRPQR